MPRQWLSDGVYFALTGTSYTYLKILLLSQLRVGIKNGAISILWVEVSIQLLNITPLAQKVRIAMVEKFSSPDTLAL